MTLDPKLQAERQQRAELERLAGEDPESWAAMATHARADAVARYQALQATKQYPGQLTKALNDISAAEKLERQIIARYTKIGQDLNKQAGQSPPQDAPTEHNAFTDQLRQEHQADGGQPAAMENDALPPRNDALPRENTAMGVLSPARGQAGDAHVDTVAA